VVWEQDWMRAADLDALQSGGWMADVEIGYVKEVVHEALVGWGVGVCLYVWRGQADAILTASWCLVVV